MANKKQTENKIIRACYYPDEKIHEIDITFEDGTRQTLAVENANKAYVMFIPK